jgi:mRNA-degrading endonuclease toxin of MazEF toxin-antitoxin module
MVPSPARLPAHARLVALVLTAVLASGCHVQTRVALPGDAPAPGVVAASTVKAGDEVRLVLRDGTIARVTVAEVTPDAIVGTGGQRYPIAEIVRLDIRSVALGRTAGVTAGIIAGTLVLFTLLMLAAGWEFAP